MPYRFNFRTSVLRDRFSFFAATVWFPAQRSRTWMIRWRSSRSAGVKPSAAALGGAGSAVPGSVLRAGSKNAVDHQRGELAALQGLLVAVESEYALREIRDLTNV